jgi:hypothetical protein
MIDDRLCPVPCHTATFDVYVLRMAQSCRRKGTGRSSNRVSPNSERFLLTAPGPTPAGAIRGR